MPNGSRIDTSPLSRANTDDHEHVLELDGEESRRKAPCADTPARALMRWIRTPYFQYASISLPAGALDDMRDGSRCQGQRPSISNTSVQLKKARTSTSPASRMRLMDVNSCAMVFTISAATSTSRPSRRERPMRIL